MQVIFYQGKVMHKVLSCSLLSFLSFAATAQQQDLAYHLTSVIDAKAVKRVNPDYPVSQARIGKDGWVIASFVVEPDGKTSNIVIEDSSGVKGFEVETRRAIKRWQYEPATEDGKPVQQCMTKVRMDFKMSRKDGITRKFRGLYKGLNKALEQKDDEAIEKYYRRLKNYKIYAGMEEQVRHSAFSDYYLYKGDKYNALAELEKSENFIGSSGLFKRLHQEKELGKFQEDNRKSFQKSNDELARKQLYPLLHKELVLALELNLISKAMRISDRLTLVAPEDKQAIYQKQYDVLKDVVDSDKSLHTQGKVSERGFWSYALLRNQFSFTNINGQLDKMDIRCRNKRHVYSINDKSSWKLPDSWQGCSILVYGEKDASLTLVEQSDSASPAT